MFRTINLGGRYITEFLARDLELSFDEAQKVKHATAAVTWEGSEADLDLSDEEKEQLKKLVLQLVVLLKS